MGWDAEDAQAMADAMSWAEKKRIEAEADDLEPYRREEERIEQDMKILAQQEEAARTHMKQRALFRKLVEQPTYDALPEGAKLPPGTYVVQNATGRIERMHYSNDLTNRIAALQAQLAELEKQKAFLSMLPQEPADRSADGNHPRTPVVYFEKQFPASPGHVYQYVAIKTTGGWDISGRQGPKNQTWHELLLWLMETSPNHELPILKVSYVEGWEIINNPTKEIER